MEIRVPTLGESVTEATIAQWFKSEGDTVAMDEPIVELETDKVTVEISAPSAGTLSEILVKDGETVEVGALLGSIGEANGAVSIKRDEAPVVEATPEPASVATVAEPHSKSEALAPAARRVITEHSLDATSIEGTGKGGRVTKGDALKALESPAARPVAAKAPAPSGSRDQADREERVPMTRLRKTIATRLKDAQNTAAMLTTFNEVDMTAVMALRSEYKDLFEKKHGVRLGFMGFFVKACLSALKDIPAVNAEVEGDDLVYKNFYNIGVAVGTDRGLVVPVVRDADRLSLGGVELAINEFGRKARDGKIGLPDLQGGTFTISNGGVYGSLMSTPILNAPQSGILGMHKIQQRPVVIDGQIEVRPMMYLALSYDHRIVDGKEAVTFLVRVKECLEGPERLLLDL